jgi:hypothetical protein
MDGAAAELVRAYAAAEDAGDEVEAGALLLELAAALKEIDDLPEPVGASPTSGNGLDTSQTVLARSTPIHEAAKGNGAGSGGHYMPPKCSRPELTVWPAPIVALELSVQESSRLLRVAQVRRDPEGAAAAARQLREATCRLAEAKAKVVAPLAEAVPDGRSRPRMRGQLISRSRAAAALRWR